MKKSLQLTLLLAIVTASGFAQSDKFWSVSYENRNSIIADKAVSRLSYPKEVKLFALNFMALNEAVLAIVDKKSTKNTTIISLPNVEGKLEQFEINEASNFEPELQAQFPEIRAFSGKGITDRYATLKLSLSPQGIQTMIFRTEKDNEFIEPYSKDHTIYAVFKSQREKGSLPWTCSTEDKKMAADLKSQFQRTQSSAGQLKTMRLAQSCNAEYSNYFGATSAAQVVLVMAAFNATITRCNGVYEKDIALHLNLIANTTSVIYYNPSTDPYSTTLSSWNASLQSTLTSIIGAANYDIGHMFGASGGGGNAGCIGCVCGSLKGSGITSPADGIPQGDNFDIDYVVHEVGHQLGGNHTFSMSNEGSGVNKEVGSGITIMGYAGITSQDVAPHSIDIYHQATIGQIQTNLATKTCPVSVTMTANHTPVVLAVGNYTIPKSTPFALTGSATDVDNDTLTYCWEQNDNATSTQTNASSVASATKATGPNWLSFKPTASGTRIFPKMSTILSGLNVTPPLTGGDAGANIEALSSVARTLNFRLTVRDNNTFVAGVKVGQTAYTDAVVTVSGTAGPFGVTAPNTAVVWNANTTQTIGWSVNSTNVAPINCTNVKISLSTDGGLTFPTVLAANTPNDGSEALLIPNMAPSTTARVKIESIGNIFFDISNTNFTIASAPACGDPTGLMSSAVTNNSATVSWTAVSGAVNYAVEYKTQAATTWTVATASTTATTLNLSGLTSATMYSWRVKATCSGGSGSFVINQFTTGGLSTCISVYDNTANNRARSAAVIPFNTDIKGTLSRVGDIDYYKFNITNGGTATISLTTLPHNYNVDLINNTGIVSLATSQNDSMTNEIIQYTYTPNTYYVKVYGGSGSGADSVNCYTLRVQLGTASRNSARTTTVKGEMVAFYPNPVNNELKVNMGNNAEPFSVVLTDMFGRRILQKNVSGTSSINTSKMTTGVYMVTVTDKNGVVIKQDKIVKD